MKAVELIKALGMYPADMDVVVCRFSLDPAVNETWADVLDKVRMREIVLNKYAFGGSVVAADADFDAGYATSDAVVLFPEA